MIYPVMKMKENRLRQLRIEHGYTQQELAKLLYVGQNSCSDYERGKRPCPLDVIVKMADLYNVSVDYLMDRTDVKEPYPPKLKDCKETHRS